MISKIFQRYSKEERALQDPHM